MHINSEQADQLIHKILYGDIHEVPLSILEDVVNVSEESMETWDTEQLTRVSIAATLKKYFEQLTY